MNMSDKNECEQTDRDYCGHGRCVNLPGGYGCYSPERKKPASKRVILGTPLLYSFKIFSLMFCFNYNIFPLSHIKITLV